MSFKIMSRIFVMLLLVSFLTGCQSPVPASTPGGDEGLSATSTVLPPLEAVNSFLADYDFPASIDPAKHYLFYLHGRIIEDQDLPAVSPDFGEYQYEAILQELESRGFKVISEQRPKDTDGDQYAQRVAEQVKTLINSGVPPGNITVVGASKGAGIAATVSSLAENTGLNFVLLGFCSPDTVEALVKNQMVLYGNVLAIRDASDDLSGSCNDLFAYSTGKGLGKHKEILLQVGTGHGILYQPLDEWIAPTVDWAQGKTLSAGEIAILESLEQVDDYPLYTMHYSGPYTLSSIIHERPGQQFTTVTTNSSTCEINWGCSLFASLGDEDNRLFGRNFDWRFSPALLLFTDPPDGYASVSMVDIEYLGFEGELSRNLTGLPLDDRRALLDAPYLPFDGMNEKGLAVGMAAVPWQEMPVEPDIKTIGALEVIREILDHAGTVEQALGIMSSYNIDMGSVPIHYLIASSSGDAAVVEFYQGEMLVFRNQTPWHAATNFLLADTDGEPQGHCWRYDRINRRLQKLEGRISSEVAFDLLAEVAQENTQWSILYHMTGGDLEVVMGRGYSETIHRFHLER